MTIIRVIDFETTGMERTDQVVEYGYCDLARDAGAGPWIVGTPKSRLCGVDTIPPEVRAVHHITMAEVADAPHFDEAEVHNPEVDVSVLAAHNLDFEDKFIPSRGLPGICTLKAALRIWPNAPNHKNGTLRYWLEDQGLVVLDHETAMPPHRAGPDAYVTAHILKALFEAGATGKDMVAWTKEPALLPACPIGKFRGKPWAEVEGGFLSWMLNQPTMEEDLKWNARRELDRRQMDQRGRA